MDLPALAELEDMEARLGVSLEAESADGERALAALEDASALVRAEGGKDWLDEHDELTDDLPAIVKQVTLAAALRAYRNPDGASQTSIGDVSVSFSGRGRVGSVYLTQDERRAVKAAAGQPAFKSIDLETPFGLRRTPANLIAVSGGGDPIDIGRLPWEE